MINCFNSGYVIVLVEKEGKIKLFGSAAERNDCDEILEINGCSPEKMTHEQIINHIHQCIKTRTICLRVKRRSSGKLGSSIDSSLIDAFVIGSRAREHLQTLTKDANITPKDIAQLSKILSENNEDYIKQQLNELENKENEIKQNEKLTKDSTKDDKTNLRKSDSGDIDYLELNDDNMQLLNINTDPNMLKKTDSQQSIVDLVKRSASISLSNTSLNKIIYKKLDDEETKKYIPFDRLNSIFNRLENLNDENLKKLFEKTNFKTLIDIYSTLMQEQYLNTENLDIDTVQLHQEVVELLQNKGNVEDDFIELLEILNKFEYDGLFQVLNYIIKCKKRTSLQNDEIQEEDDSLKEEVLEEDVFFKDDKKDESLIEESISLKEEINFNELKEKTESDLGLEKLNEIDDEESKGDELEFDESIKESENLIKDELTINENLIEDKNENLPPIPPPLPITIINSLNLDQVQKTNLITTTAEIPSLASLASNMQPISSYSITQSTPLSESQKQINNVFSSTTTKIQQQTILQNTFLTTVNDALNNFADNSNDQLNNQASYCKMQQQQQQSNQNLLYNMPLDKQSFQNNLCNLEYSNTIPLQTVTPIPVISSFDLPLNSGIQLNELPITNLQNLQNIQNVQNLTNNQPTISALEYANGSIPPAPQPPLITNLPPNLNNLPPDLPPKLSIVRIEKHSSEPLGATVRNEMDGRVTIGRIVCGGAAEKCHALQEGDEILMVNNVYIRGKTVDQVCELLSLMEGVLTFVIAKRDSTNLENKNEQSKLNVTNVQRKSSTSSHDSSILNNCKAIHLKAFFDYNPNEDLYIPCKELGLSFRKGDLLHVIDSSDECWHQAYREGDLNQNLAGLIPSLKFQKMREEVAKKLIEQNEKKNEENQIEVDSTDSSVHRHRTSLLFNCGKSRSTSKKRKVKKEEISIQDYYTPYEEMKQSMGHKRTVILLGPNGIGRQSLRERLVKQNQYGTAIPHTSRPKRNDEMNGEDYYFVSKQQFEQFIEEDKFVEYGDYDRNYYGTSYSSIEDVLKSNKTCILNLHVQSIFKLRTPITGKKFKPFFILILPTVNLDALRKLVESVNNVPISINELHGIINEGFQIKKHLAHYFDLIVTISDIEETYKLLLNEIKLLDLEPQWLPASWL